MCSELALIWQNQLSILLQYNTWYILVFGRFRIVQNNYNKSQLGECLQKITYLHDAPTHASTLQEQKASTKLLGLKSLIYSAVSYMVSKNDNAR